MQGEGNTKLLEAAVALHQKLPQVSLTVFWRDTESQASARNDVNRGCAGRREQRNHVVILELAKGHLAAGHDDVVCGSCRNRALPNANVSGICRTGVRHAHAARTSPNRVLRRGRRCRARCAAAVRRVKRKCHKALLGNLKPQRSCSKCFCNTYGVYEHRSHGVNR